MKLNKEQLKDIVKECLVEILSEGIGAAPLNESRAVSQIRTTPARPTSAITGRATTQSQQVPRQSIHDKISFVPNRDQLQKSTQVSKKINPLSFVGDITSDPIMAGVLADTAQSGRHTTMNESSRGPTYEDQVMSSGDHAAKMMLNADPMDVFGDSSSMWATLAFSEKVQK